MQKALQQSQHAHFPPRTIEETINEVKFNISFMSTKNEEAMINIERMLMAAFVAIGDES